MPKKDREADIGHCSEIQIGVSCLYSKIQLNSMFLVDIKNWTQGLPSAQGAYRLKEDGRYVANRVHVVGLPEDGAVIGEASRGLLCAGWT